MLYVIPREDGPTGRTYGNKLRKVQGEPGEGWVSLSSVKVDKQGRASPAEGTPGKGLGMGEAKYGQPRLQALAQGCG